MYHQLLDYLDLCMLADHLHGQTLVWPTKHYMAQLGGKSPLSARDARLAPIADSFSQGRPGSWPRAGTTS